ncbi:MULTISPECIES: saccharopine dehydrogenase NADP-binding domain-containing protein [unclassified Nocardia]|uniref:saccharopine dehydrogenase NADP-binding domain-containing protein n=1 Tax=unclassified Nocardia TaxID=2637762 RepID=UPI001CE3C810|nr:MULTISPECIES: saccharopine dehydrogenase NADP-binding domain-containing protein [unclassified Nocardia]
MTERIGILGGYGSVGTGVAERLVARGAGEVLIAGRDPIAGRRLIAEKLRGAGDFLRVDLADDDALAQFCARCAIVVNCAGPSRRILDRVARAARRAGARYVDIGGDEPVHNRLSDTDDWCAVLSAGMIPGLTGLLPRYLARDFDTVDALTVYHGIFDTFGAATAYDYVVGVLDGDDMPLAAWRDGIRDGVVVRRNDIRLPNFPEPVTALPYLSREACRTARWLGLGSGTWFSILQGERLPLVLQGIPGTPASAVAEMAEKVRRAAELDVLGRTPHAILLFELVGRRAGQAITRSLVLRADRAAALTAAAAVSVIGAVADGRIESGVHFAADVVPPGRSVAELGADPAVVQLSEHEIGLDELVELDEGAI